VTAASARIITAVTTEDSSSQCNPTVRAMLSSVCVTTVDNSVYVSYFERPYCPYILDARLALWVSLEHVFTCVSTTNQAEQRSSAAHLLAIWEHKRTRAQWSHAQGGGPSVIPTAGIHYKLWHLLT